MLFKSGSNPRFTPVYPMTASQWLMDMPVRVLLEVEMFGNRSISISLIETHKVSSGKLSLLAPSVPLITWLQCIRCITFIALSRKKGVPDPNLFFPVSAVEECQKSMSWLKKSSTSGRKSAFFYFWHSEFCPALPWFPCQKELLQHITCVSINLNEIRVHLCRSGAGKWLRLLRVGKPQQLWTQLLVRCHTAGDK